MDKLKREFDRYLPLDKQPNIFTEFYDEIIYVSNGLDKTKYFPLRFIPGRYSVYIHKHIINDILYLVTTIYEVDKSSQEIFDIDLSEYLHINFDNPLSCLNVGSSPILNKYPSLNIGNGIFVSDEHKCLYRGFYKKLRSFKNNKVIILKTATFGNVGICLVERLD